jgi:predicted Zn-dependent protease
MKKLFLAILLAGVMLAAVSLAQIPNIPGLDKDAQKNIEKGIEAGKKVDEANKPWKIKDERATGRALAAKVAKNFGGLYQDKAWDDYVNLVGRSLAIVSKRTDTKYRFAILNDNSVNAYSCPGGYIFITKGLLKRIKNEAQLAGVLGHEIGHVSAKHIENELKKQQNLNIGVGLGVDVAGDKLSKKDVKMIADVTDGAYDILISKGYAREDEFEADKLGCMNIYQLGYAPQGMVQLLKQLQEGGKSKDTNVLFSTHPPTPDRIQALNDFIAKKGWSDEGRSLMEERWQKMMAEHPLK